MQIHPRSWGSAVATSSLREILPRDLATLPQCPSLSLVARGPMRGHKSQVALPVGR